MKNLALIGCLSAITLPISLSTVMADQPAGNTHSIIQEKANEWLNTYIVPSVAIAYIEAGTLQWISVHGEQSPGKPASENTLYNVASMTKPISAETILRLASKEEISLDEALSTHWIDPDINDDPRHTKLTPLIALQHRTGFANWRDDKLHFQFEPGEKSQYSGEGYNYVARFAENKMGLPFNQLARMHVLAPEGIKDAAFVKHDWFADRVATPMGPDNQFGEPDIRSQWNAADDLHITIGDYARFMIAVMNNTGVSATIAEQRFITNENLFEQGCPWGSDSCPEHAGFAMGWAVFQYPDETVIMHGGGDWGERTLGFFVPERNLGIVVFTNGANGSSVIKQVVETLYPNNDFIEFLAFQANQN